MSAPILRILAPAKVNLHLSVGPTRPDGYHELTTVFQALAFGDTVTITDDGSESFTCTPDLGLPAEQNLAHRAARAMSERFERPVGYSIAIEKRIPAGAGLGGASTDAAAVVEGLATLWGITPSDQAVLDVARSLGADVPFFFEGGTALFTGRGDVLDRRLMPLDAPVVLVKPRTPVNTAEAYVRFDALAPAEGPPPDRLLDALEARDPTGVAAALFNNMTSAAIALVPEVGVALDLVRGRPGVLGAAVAGSGSSVFGVCDSPESAADVADAAREAGFWAQVTAASDHGCVLGRL